MKELRMKELRHGVRLLDVFTTKNTKSTKADENIIVLESEQLKSFVGL